MDMRSLVIGIGLMILLMAPAQGQTSPATPPPDTSQTPVQVQRSGPVGSGLMRVRQRIAQIRGQQMSSAAGPIIITVPRAPSSAAAAPAVPQDPEAQQRPVPQQRPAAGVTRADLNRFETRLMRRLEILFDELYANLGASAPQAPDVVVAPQTPPPAPRAPADSLRAAPPPSPDSARMMEAPPRADSIRQVPREASPPTVVEVRRALLETGLFRALDINFETGSATVSPRATQSLTAIGEVLAQYPAVRVEIAGHTDSTGSDAVNQRLSQQRAEAVRDHLLRNFSIPPDRLTARGYGSSQPIASNDSRTGRALNRRVEFRVLNPDAAERVLEDAASPDTTAQQLEDVIRRTIEEELQRRGAPPDTSSEGNLE